MQPDNKGQPENVAVVTVLVTPSQAEVLTLASSEGRIQLALRNNSDEKTAETAGVRAVEIFRGAGRPEPEPSRPVRAAAPRPAPVAVAAPAPPPPPQIELIKGDRKSIEVVEMANR